MEELDDPHPPRDECMHYPVRGTDDPRRLKRVADAASSR